MSDNYEVVVDAHYPWEHKLMEGNEGAFCKCGRVLQIKRPKIKTWHQIKCPKCGFIINIFCGECGEPLSMDAVNAFVPSVGTIGD